MRNTLRILAAMLVLCVIAGCARPDPVTKMPTLHGQTRTQIVAALGQPESAVTFPMSEQAGEFRIELQNTYPLSVAGNGDVEIEEVMWKDGDYWITLWLHKVDGEWVVLDSCRWHKDVAF